MLYTISSIYFLKHKLKSDSNFSMSSYARIKKKLLSNHKTWLITGVAGFIGSNLLETLLDLNQIVVGVDNFSTGNKKNLNEVQSLLPSKQWKNFTLIHGDVTDIKVCKKACKNVDYILHQAALGSVPRSIKDPIATNQSNILGFLNMLVAARDANVKRFVYAASSSTYGDHKKLPKREHIIGKPLSPYAVTKYVNELYADVFHLTYGLDSIGLRYFNVFGKRQTAQSAYAAVIPRWIDAIIRNQEIFINGDGKTSRDFCYVDNAVQANILAATTSNLKALNQIYNVAVGDRTSLNDLYMKLKILIDKTTNTLHSKVNYRDFRDGDVRHSQADISKISNLLSFNPTHRIDEGLFETVKWHFTRRRS